MDGQDIAESRLILEKKWDAEGDCASCGWHACLYEHEVTDDDIKDALIGDGFIRLGCLNKDDDGSLHRGIKIYISKDTKMQNQDVNQNEQL